MERIDKYIEKRRYGNVEIQVVDISMGEIGDRWKVIERDQKEM